MDTRTVLELRCVLRLYRGELLLDAELVEQAAGGAIATTLLACNAVAMSTEPATPGWSADDRRWMTDVIRWLSDEAGHDHDPAHLPNDDVSTFWGTALARSLELALGTGPLDDLLLERAADGKTHVRLIFRAADRAAARLPVETLVWPPGKNATALVLAHDRSISIVRTADSVDLRTARGLALGARRPGRDPFRRAAVVAAGRTLDYVNPTEVAAAAELLGQAAPVHSGSFDEQLIGAAATADALLICGHGNGADGLDIGSGEMRDGGTLAQLVTRGPGAAPGAIVLAMCGSGQPGTGGNVSPALHMARAGVALCIGFQGDRAAVRHVGTFLTSLAAVMGPTVTGEEAGAPIGLLDWERAIRSARQENPAASVVPVIYAHPSLLAGRQAPTAAPIIAKLPTRRPRTETATPFYVPGQILCLRAEQRDLRVPLPVDIGARVHVTVSPGRAHPKIDRDLAISSDDAVVLISSWANGAQAGVKVVLRRGPWDTRVVRDWARRSAELSAVARALAKAFGTEVPATAVRLVERAVATDWGARGAAPELLDVDTGAAVKRLGLWPALDVAPAEVRLIGRDDPPPLRDDLATLGTAPDDLQSAFVTATGVLELIASQLEALRDVARDRSSSMSGRIREAVVVNVTRANLVVVPSAASVREGRRRGTSPVGLGVEAEAASAPTDLD